MVAAPSGRWVAILLIGVAAVLSGVTLRCLADDTTPTGSSTDTPIDQQTIDDAYQRLAAKEAVRKAAATRPDHLAAASQPSDPEAMAAIDALISDCNKVFSRSDSKPSSNVLSMNDVSDPLAASCFGNLRRKKFHLVGSVFGTTVGGAEALPGAAAGPAVQNVALVYNLERCPAADKQWQVDYITIKKNSDSKIEEKKLDEATKERAVKHDTKYAGNIANLRTQLADDIKKLEDTCASDQKTKKTERPVPTVVHVYLEGSDPQLQSAKRGQVIEGHITFTDGSVTSTDYKVDGGGAPITYATEVSLTGTFSMMVK
jgi:hypothetical protein